MARVACIKLSGFLLMAVAQNAPAQQGAPNGEWRTYGGDLGHTRYAPLDEIDASNFNRLEIAWRFKTDSLGPNREFNFQSTPLMVDGVVYSTAGSRRAVVALDAGNGELLWIHRLDEGQRGQVAPRQLSGRGLAYWESGDDKRIVYVTPGYQMIALDARTGDRVETFGDGGIVDLKQNIDQNLDPLDNEIGLHATPIVAKNVIIVGAAHPTGANPTSARVTKGYVRGFDARTGERLWIFHTVPMRGEFGTESWLKGSNEYTGNTGVWAQISVDPELETVYLPVEQATGDYFGAERPGDNLFAETLLAVDLNTGERKWHYQLVHHGIWDMDIPCAPILFDAVVDGRAVKAVAQPTKQAFLYVFDRVTGRPLWPIEERPVPKGEVPGEWYAPTQPIPSKPPAYDRQGITEGDLIDFTPELRREALEVVAWHKMGPLFTPPVVSNINGPLGTLMVPSQDGGTNWQGGSFDPETGILYVASGSTVVQQGRRAAVSRPVRDGLHRRQRSHWAAHDGRVRLGRRRRPQRVSARGAPRADTRRCVARAAEARARRAGLAAPEAAVRAHQRDRHEARRDPLASRARRDARRHQEPSTAERSESAAHGPGRLAGHARDEDALDRRRAFEYDDARRAGRDAARLRQSDGARGRRRLHAGAAKRVADDVPARRRAVSRRRDQRCAVRRRALGVQVAATVMAEQGGSWPLGTALAVHGK